MQAFNQPYNREISEQKLQQFWHDHHIYQFDENSNKPIFSIDTPPPYVSADHLHAGHIMSYGQADFIARYKRMRGYNVFYPMGFDDNGLPTERFVEKKFNIQKSKITREAFVQLCLEETARGAQTYKDLWEKLGISVDWSKIYSTITPIATKVSQWSLLDLYHKGVLYRDNLPVLWCTHCETALAQADLIDIEEVSHMYHIVFEGPEKEALIIATTRPELLPACVALYVHPDDIRYQHLVGKQAMVPLFHLSIPVRTSEKVLKDFGTGLMMVCTWGDKEDIEKWQENKLETRAIVATNGKMNILAGPYTGLTLAEAREQIVSDLEASHLLIKREPIKHIKQVDERCGTPAEFILSKQWFIKIAELKETWLAYGKKIQWHPQNRVHDYNTWVNSLKWDWCISRQRFYGVPLPIWYCMQCDEPIFATLEQLPVHPKSATPPISECPKCSGKTFRAEKDVADTWATSSCTPFLLRELLSSKEQKENVFPVSLRPNGFEIIRTCDFYSIVKSHYHFGDIPFRDVMISGHGVDDKGRKISKSLGNYIPSEKLIEQYGSDAIRFWATGAKLGQNLRFSIEEIQKGKKTVQKLWNVARFYSLYMISMKELSLIDQALEPADVWILQELNLTIEKATAGFEKFEYSEARETINDFFWKACCDYYIEFIKYRLMGNDTASKEAAIATLHTILCTLLHLFAPIMPFITEAIYQELFSQDHESSIHRDAWPDAIPVSATVTADDFELALRAIDEIRKFKSAQGISLGTPIVDYALTCAVNLSKYESFIKGVMRISNLVAASESCSQHFQNKESV